MNTPSTKFVFENNNTQVTTPENGITNVIAVTTKGNPEDPSEVMSSYQQFVSTFGSEVVPDGSISNIEVALKTGSKLRVSRVMSSTRSKGNIVVGVNTAGAISGSTDLNNDSVIGFMYSPAVAGAPNQYISFKAKSKGFGDALSSNSTKDYAIKLSKTTSGRVTSLYLEILENKDVTSTLVKKYLVTKYTESVVNSSGFIDVALLNSFLNNNAHFDFTVGLALEDYAQDIDSGIASIEDALNQLSTWLSGTIVFYSKIDGPLQETPLYLLGNIGSRGGEITLADWKKAYDSLADYYEAYQVIASHANQHLSDQDYLSLLKYIRDDVDPNEEMSLFVEVPKQTSDGIAMSYTDIIDWAQNTIETIGPSKMVSFFAGGWKYYNSNNVLTKCDSLGTVIGLANTSESKYGPYRHFSGSRRGVAVNAVGIVSPNYGAPSNITKLNAIANAAVNMSVIRQNSQYNTKKATLVHNFTSQEENNSFQYLGVLRLCLFLKKKLRPIVDSYHEEPNIWTTWKRMYKECWKVIEPLIGDAITDPVYSGDQDATQYKDLQINTEANVRSGKYKVIFKFKDIVAMQEIEFVLQIDKSSGTSSVSFNNAN